MFYFLDSSSQYLITDAFSTLIQSSPEMVTEQSMCDSINIMIGAVSIFERDFVVEKKRELIESETSKT